MKNSSSAPATLLHRLPRYSHCRPLFGRAAANIITQGAANEADNPCDRCSRTCPDLQRGGTSPDRQLATIRSRCQVVHFAPLADELVAELLRAQGVEDSALIERLVRLSGGSPGRARALADPALWEFRRQMLGQLSRSPVDTVGLARSWMRFVEEAGKEAAAQRQRAAQVLELLIDFLSAALSRSVGATPKLAEPEDLRALEELVRRTEPNQLSSVLDSCLEAGMHVDRRVQLVLIVEALVDALGQRLRSA